MSVHTEDFNTGGHFHEKNLLEMPRRYSYIY